MFINDFEIKILQFESIHEAQAGVNRYIKELNEEGRRIIEMEEDVFQANGVRFYEYRFRVDKLSDQEKQELTIQEAREKLEMYRKDTINSGRE